MTRRHPGEPPRPPGPKPRSVFERVVEKVALNDNGCLIWTGSRSPLGYGRIVIGSLLDGSKRQVFAHRLVYEMLVGPIPDGFVIDHLCRVPSCVHPEHLEPVTQRENLLRGETLPAQQAARDACSHGHPYSPENLVTYADGVRRCRTCTNHRARLSRAARKEAS